MYTSPMMHALALCVLCQQDRHAADCSIRLIALCSVDRTSPRMALTSFIAPHLTVLFIANFIRLFLSILLLQ